tara:strand:+ start:352971 stop:354122 length:1152 start_codon:yes stop_codon:yes gene_type:complete
MSYYPMVSIEEVTNNLDSKRIPLNSQQRKLKESNPVYPYVGANNILGFIDEYIFDEKILCVAEDGGSWGLMEQCSFIMNQKCWVNNHAHVLTARENLHLEYLSYYLNYADLNPHITGSTRGKLNKGRLNKIKIPLPPLKTQQRIAAILDDAAALRDKTAQLLTEYDLLAQSIFLEMFGDPVINQKGWSKRKGLNFYDVKGRVGWKGYKKTDLRDEGPIVLGATHIDKFGNVNTAKSVHITREKYLESPEIFIERNDLIFVQRGNTIGKIGIVNFDIGEATINPVVLILRAVGKNNPFFLLHLMMTENLKKEVVDLNSGSAQPMITQKSIKEYDIIDVPVKLQNQFAEKISLIEQQKALAKQELQESEDLFNCLLQKAFKGELV